MKKIIVMNILIAVSFFLAVEGSLSLIFYIKDAKGPLILSKDVVDFPYLYYTFLPKKEGGKTVVNEDGLYSPYSRKKEKDTIRIALLGGSSVRGMSVSTYDNTISAVLERMLRKEFPNKKIEVINAGMTGYVVEQAFIFYQLILSRYSPDVVVGLNGYNDLMSVKLNRYSGLFFGPQNMQQFMVIENGKGKATLSGRFENIFPSIFRFAGSITRYVSGQGHYDYSAFSDAEIKEASLVYIGIIKDMHSFCNANRVSYFEFLEPIRWYLREDYEESIKRGGIVQLVKLYSLFEKNLTELNYGYSLTNLFNNKEDIFKDDCHVSDVGNELFALAMLRPIKEEIRKK